MKKTVFVDTHAQKELKQLPEIVRAEFKSLFTMLAMEGKLNYPDAKKIDKNLFEIRVSIQDAYRGFYAYVQSKDIIVLHVFQKKTQKTPLKNIKTAYQRLKHYE